MVVIDADLMVGFIRLGARHFFDLSVEVGYEILLDLGLYR